MQITHAITLENLVSGAVNEAFEHELSAVLRNMLDPNTIAIEKRKLTIDMAISPSSDRSYATVTIRVRSSCGGHNTPIETSILVSGGSDHAVATERLTEQTSLFQ